MPEMQNYGAEINLHPSLRDFPRNKEQVERLLELQELAEGHYYQVVQNMEQYSFKNAREEEEKAFKKLNDLIAYCEKFTAPEAYIAQKKLLQIQLPMATDPNRFKKQQMKTSIKADFKERLLDGFSNKESIASALLTLTSI